MKIGIGQLNDIDYKACWKREYFEIVNGDGWAFHVVCGMPVSFCALSQEFRVHRHNFLWFLLGFMLLDCIIQGIKFRICCRDYTI